jgi:hypothetical protein
VIGGNSWFVGWRGEAPVIRQEDVLKSGGLLISFYTPGAGGRKAAVLTPPVTQGETQPDPAGLAKGTLLVLDYQSMTANPKIIFELNADGEKVRALETAIQNWTPGNPVSLPEVPATLKILRSSPGESQHTVLWRASRKLSAYPGESGYVYTPPDLKFAYLSPTGGRLLAVITQNDGLEYVVISMRPGRR